MMKKEAIFPVIKNRKNFLLEEVPNLHPESAKYITFWRDQKRKCIEGFWNIDGVSENDGYRYMPPNLYFYVNFGIILHKPANAPRTAPKKRIRPYLRDIEWAFFYNFMEARGFSGFSEDEEYSCCIDILKYENDKLLLEDVHLSCIKPNGEIKQYINPRDYIRKIFNKPMGLPLYFNEAKSLMLLGCHPEETKIVTYTGEYKNIEDIRVGDKLVGIDNCINNVIETFSGDSMFITIKSRYSDPYQITYSHTLHLKQYSKYGVFEKECFLLPEELDFENKRYESVKSTLIEYDKKELKLDPYFIGLWLGDGFKREKLICVSQKDNEILDWLKKYANSEERFSYSITKSDGGLGEWTYRFRLIDSTMLHKGNYWSRTFLNNKNIPIEYLTSCSGDRLKLLAGYIDSDGYYECGRFRITSVDLDLLNQTKQLCESLGFFATISKPRITGISNSLRYDITITGNISIIPTLLNRKKANNSNLGKGHNRDYISIDYGDIGKFYGFNTDGNHTYLLNNYVSTHNARGGGKSYMLSVGVALFEILFDGARYYDEESRSNPAVAEVFVGSALSSKSSEFLKKAKEALVNLPGKWATGTDEEIPSPFYKDMAGSLEPNNMKNAWTHSYDKKIGGKWQKAGSGSHIYHGIWTTENPEAAAGTRPGIIIVEEAGLVPNLLTVHGSNEGSQVSDGTDRFGSSFYIGCVCEGTKVWTNDGRLVNIENLKQEDGIIGYHSAGCIPQSISSFNPPQSKPCYRINIEGGDFLECSEDHPILISKSKYDRNIDWTKYRLCTFRETKNITDKDQIAVIESVPVFGEYNEPDARLLGMLIGDGYLSGCTAEISVDSDETICYLKSFYDVTLKKSFQTKAGYEYRSYNIKGINDLLRSAGIKGQVKNDKTLPINIDQYDKQSLADLLGGYFDADGTVKYGNNGNVQVCLTSNSKDLLYSVKYRLLKFGIESSVYIEKRLTGYNGGSINKYVLYISHHESVIRFAENIQFLTRRKQDRLLEVFQYKIKKNYRTSNQLKYISGDDGNFFEGTDIVNEIKFKKIKSIEYIGEKPVYNLTADGTHSYLANNFITHNTGGNMEKIVEAEIIFRDPEGFDMMAFDDEWEGTGKLSWFVPATYMDGKFKDENGNTKLKEAEENYQHRREQKRKARSKSALDLEMMNFPLIPSEMFLNVGNNKFPVADLKYRYAELLSTSRDLDSVWKGFFRLDQNGKPVWSNENVSPIIQYPLKQGDDVNGCPAVFEMPMKGADGNIPYGIYIAGFDPVDDDDNSDIGRSLQSFWIMNTITDRMCLEYSARTRHASEFYEQVRRCLIAYNATVNYENQKKGFYAYMKNKNALHLLADTPEILKDSDMQKSVGVGNKSKGTSSNTATNNWGIEMQIEWLESPAYGVEGKTNMQLVKSPAYLRECILYDGVRNTDRISSMGMLMIYREDCMKRTMAAKRNLEKKSESISDKFLERSRSSRLSYNDITLLPGFRRTHGVK